jgi:cytochrome c553
MNVMQDRITKLSVAGGPALKGAGTTPALAGRHAGYTVRQLYFFQNGSRSGPDVALMHNVVRRLTDDDMLAISAYVASLQP